MALHRLAKRWPPSLTLVSTGAACTSSTLVTPRYSSPLGTERVDAVIQTIDGIPNDGGDW